MSGSVLFPGGFTLKPVLDGTEKVPVDGDREYATTAAIAALGAAAPQTTQTVTSSPATVAAKFVTLATDDYDSGTPGVLYMPPITAGAWHVISTAFENVYFNVEKAPGDPANTGPGLLIDSAFIRRQAIIMHAAYVDEGGGPELRWQFDANGYYLKLIFEGVTPLFSQVAALESGRLHVPSTRRTLFEGPQLIDTGVSTVYQAYPGEMLYLLPPAIAGMTVEIIKETLNPGEITVRPDAGMEDFVNESTDDYVLDGSDYVSSTTTARKRWKLYCAYTGAWQVVAG